MIILDTNVLSELMKPEPHRGVVKWLGGLPAARLFTTSITKAEMLHGILLLPPGRRRQAFERAAEGLFEEDFSGRVLPFTAEASLPYATIAATRRAAGRPISHFDAQIAAIVAANMAILATRNISDFESCGIDLVDPWAS